MPGESTREGQVLAGKYKLGSRLGAGGMGEVYRALNTAVGREVAIKLLHREHAQDERFVARFLTEARAANIVRHPNVVDVLDVGRDDDGTPFIVEELLEGEDLSSHLASLGGRMRAADVIALMLPLADAVAAAHAKGIVHRDLKPENVFLARGNGGVVPKLLDFGISQVTPAPGAHRLTATGTAVGTPMYMSPEQVTSSKRVDARSDVWALGVIMYELLSGNVPFASDTPGGVFVQIATEDPLPIEEAAPEVPRDLARVVARCLQKKREDRYASARELALELRILAEGGSLPASAAPDRARAMTVPIELSHAAVSPRGEDPAPMPVPDLDLPLAPTSPPARSPTPAARGGVVELEPEGDPEADSGLQMASVHPPAPSAPRMAAPAYRPLAAAPARDDHSGALARGAIVAAVALLGAIALGFVLPVARGWTEGALGLAGAAASVGPLVAAAVALALALFAGRGAAGAFGEEGGRARGVLLALLATAALFAATALARGSSLFG